MERAHNQMKRAHKDDYGTNLVCTQGSIGVPYMSVRFLVGCRE